MLPSATQQFFGRMAWKTAPKLHLRSCCAVLELRETELAVSQSIPGSANFKGAEVSQGVVLLDLTRYSRRPTHQCLVVTSPQQLDDRHT